MIPKKLFRLSWIAAALLLLAFALSACNISLAADVTPPPGYQPPTQAAPKVSFPLVAPDPAAGKAIFTEKCIGCHGERGLGDGPQAAQLPSPVAAIGDPNFARQSTPSVWFNIVLNGNMEQYMPPFSGSLSERQVWDVLAYVYSLSTPQGVLTQGEQIFTQNCAACHGPSGQGDGPNAASLSSSPADFTDQSFMAQHSLAALFQSVTNGTGDMPAFGSALTEADRWAALEYIRSLSWMVPAEQAAAASSATQTGEIVTPSVEGTPTTAPASQTGGIVTGKITNGSGGELPADLTVVLHGYDNMQEAASYQTTAQADGSFTFENVDMPAERVFLVTVDYGNLTYNSDIAVAQAATDNFDFSVVVYDSSTDVSALTADRMHIFFDFSTPGIVQVVELYVISNPTPNVITASEAGQPVITFALPDGAQNLQFQDGALGDRYVTTDTGFGDTAPIRPGSGNDQVLFAFELPYKNKLEIAQPFEMPVGAVVVLIPENGVKIKSDQMEDSGTRDIQGTTFHMFSGTALNTGDVLNLSLRGKPSGPNVVSDTGSTSNLAIGLSALGLVLIAAGIWLFRRTRGQNAEDEEEILKEEDFDLPDGADAEMLMDAILTLDDLYKDGQIPEAVYQQRRELLKAHLKDQMAKE